MKIQQAIEALTTAIFENMVNSLEAKLTSASLKKELQYNCDALNNSLFNDFLTIKEVLQKVVDKYYFNYYEVEGYQQITLCNMQSSISHNLSLVRNAKKLIKFIS